MVNKVLQEALHRDRRNTEKGGASRSLLYPIIRREKLTKLLDNIPSLSRKKQLQGYRVPIALAEESNYLFNQ